MSKKSGRPKKKQINITELNDKISRLRLLIKNHPASITNMTLTQPSVVVAVRALIGLSEDDLVFESWLQSTQAEGSNTNKDVILFADYNEILRCLKSKLTLAQKVERISSIFDLTKKHTLSLAELISTDTNSPSRIAPNVLRLCHSYLPLSEKTQVALFKKFRKSSKKIQ